MEEKLETVETVKEVVTSEGETKEVIVKTVEEKQPKTEMTEEEAKIAAENVKQLLKLMEQYKSPKERQAEKLKKMEEEYEQLPEDHYKKKQLAGKIYMLNKKVNPTVIWDSSKGVYHKGMETEKIEVVEQEATTEE